ncbi:MAG: DNA-3-methyladenine glycosylase [Lewinellaceae bacterium]|nr:DNA-3-methyladenine glycosylase [Lewinellaceae bacterium]
MDKRDRPPAGKRLDAAFFQREDVLQISRELLGMVLCTQLDGQFCAARIVETEAYRAPEDAASHAYQGRRTPRTEVIFQAGGHAYVYLCYGIHHLFNLVTGVIDQPHVVLVRAVEPLENVSTMLTRRAFAQLKPQLTAGPGVMSKAMGITTALSGTNTLAPKSSIWVEDRGLAPAADSISQGTRVGVAYAGAWALQPWRFWIKNSPWVSRAQGLSGAPRGLE